ncbi:MAG: diguanylate cyclase domain-containing protein [Kiloniellaceae bacterium]
MRDGKQDSGAGCAFGTLAVREALDSLHIGLSIFDADLRLVACNRVFLKLLDFPATLGEPGTPLEAFIRLNTERGNNGEGDVDAIVAQRLAEARILESRTFQQTLSNGTVVEVVRCPLPSGGQLSTYTDITEITRAREALEEKERELTRNLEDIDLERAMVEQQAQQMVQMAEDLALQNKEIEKSRAESEFQARHDELTALPNRRFFLDYLDQTLGVARSAGAAKALLFVDLDNFKPVNDILGHDVGDGLLRKVAMRLTASVRDSDFVARLGGDEFAVIAAMKPEKGLDGVRVVAERILEALDMEVENSDPPIAVAASIGVAVFPADADSHEGLLRRADQAMYEAKNGGRNRIVFACEIADAPAPAAKVTASGSA